MLDVLQDYVIEPFDFLRERLRSLTVVRTVFHRLEVFGLVLLEVDPQRLNLACLALFQSIEPLYLLGKEDDFCLIVIFHLFPIFDLYFYLCII